MYLSPPVDSEVLRGRSTFYDEPSVPSPGPGMEQHCYTWLEWSETVTVVKCLGKLALIDYFGP